MNNLIVHEPDGSRTYRIEIENGRAFKHEISADSIPPDQSNAESRLFICDGLTDLQVNGYRGIDFGDSSLSIEHADSICKMLAAEGVTHFLATLTTQSFVGFEQALSNLDRLAGESALLGKMMLGIHLEGPFISPIDGPRGAHPKAHCREPNVGEFERLQSASGNRIKIVTMSPEYEQSAEFIRQVSPNVIVSIGHTAATPEQIRAAVDAGATMSTHLGNGMHKELVRHPNYLWEQIAEDRLNAGLIGEGVHLDAAVLKSIIRAKGVERCFLVSDSTLLSGEPPGLYSNSALGDVEVTEDRRLVIAGQRAFNAGAYRPLRDAMPFLLQNKIANLPEVLQMMIDNPRRILSEKFGDKVLGEKRENSFVVFEIDAQKQLIVKVTVVNGEVVFATAL